MVPLWGYKMNFFIEKKQFQCKKHKKNELFIKSITNGYKVRFLKSCALINYVKSDSRNVIIIDSLIKKKYFKNRIFAAPLYEIKASENVKNIEKSLT